ncbi:hypothetical protein CBR_g12139 [Chara braunii]|uniref:Uncharacterized protein n=1 Tax=Chara braunii TaxID=69332 RepID=A0A388KRB0_CHABU|nr:hypothetical protein CBR_g12139 [Chara braunii]|eukprot:GBG72569.1 hypothetical protein CBR_g12139 [Chara braunii]
MVGDVVKEEFGDVLGLAGGGARDEMGALGKATNNDIDAIVTMVGRGETTDEGHGGGYGKRLEFSSLGLVGVLDGLASRARTNVGFDVGKERGPIEVTGDSVKVFLETEVSNSLGVVMLNQELGTETTGGRDPKAAGSFGVDVEEMVDEGVVSYSVKVTEFGVGRGKVREGGVAMDERMLKRLGEVDMSHGSEDFLRGLVIGSAREGIDNTIGLVGSMADGEGKLGEKVFHARGGKSTFAKLSGELLLAEDGKYLLDMLKVGLEGGTEDKDVVEVDHDTKFKEITEDVVDGGLEHLWGICEAKRHHKELVMPKARAEGGLVGMFLVNADLVEATAEVNLGEVFGSMEAIKKFRYPGE